MAATTALGLFALTAFTLAVLALAAFAQSASAGALLPDKAVSPGAEQSINLLTVMLMVGTVAVIGVAVMLIAGLRKETEGLIQRSAGPVKAGGLVAFLALSAIGIYTYLAAAEPDPATAKLGIAGYQPVPTNDPKGISATLRNPREVKEPEGDYLRVYVNGQQFLWRYTYVIEGEQVANYETLVIPTGIPVLLDVTSSDVIHSWWVPRVGGTIDAVPGYVNQAWIKIDKPGVYRGSSTGISGVNYPSETITVKAVEPAEFAKWLAQQRAGIAKSREDLTEYRAGQQAEAAKAAGEGAVK